MPALAADACTGDGELVFAVQQGTCYAADTWWVSEDPSSLRQMEAKRMAKSDDVRIV